MDSRFLNVVVNGDSMWPTLKQGSTAKFERIDPNLVAVGQIVLLDHPFRPNLRIIKRVQSIEDSRLFLVGDNPDPTASEDSHNFGEVDVSSVIAVLVPQ
ncbi:MAG: S24 family peptidase [Candidatus Thermoplasmatota archaeon]|nr:S24 family peptidase [Candidatus Thermoplasmatota archaeon]